jgi:hypothetical protein
MKSERSLTIRPHALPRHFSTSDLRKERTGSMSVRSRRSPQTAFSFFTGAHRAFDVHPSERDSTSD